MPVNHIAESGQSFYVRFNNATNTEVNLTEGDGKKKGVYTATDAQIRSAGLEFGAHSYRIFTGTVATASATDGDTLDATGVLTWSQGGEAVQLGTSIVGVSTN